MKEIHERNLENDRHWCFFLTGPAATIGLEVKYPTENVKVIRTIVKPTGKPVDVADGITWYLNPKLAIKFGDGKPRQLKNKTAGVLRTDRTVADPLVSYDVRIFVRGRKELSSVYTTAMMNDGKLHVIGVSAPIDEGDEIERVEFTRQRHALLKLDKVAVRRDFLSDLKK